MSPRHHGPMGPEKRHIDKKTMKRLAKETKSVWAYFILAAILLIGGVVCEVIAPNYLKVLTDEIGNHVAGAIDLDVVSKNAFILIAFYLTYAISSYFATFLLATGVQHFCNHLRQNISEKINRIPLSYFDSHSSGDTMSRVTNDVDSISQNLSDALSSIVSGISMILFCLVAMFVSCWQLAFVAIACVPLSIAFLAFDMKLASPRFRHRQKMLGRVNGVVEENVTGQFIIKLFHSEDRASEVFEKENQELGHAMFAAQIYGGLMMPVTNFISYLAYIAVLIAGGLFLGNSVAGITIGTVNAFLVYVRLFQSPFTQLSQALNSLQTVSAASGRVFEFLGELELSNDSAKPYLLGRGADVKGAVDFDHVHFSYDSSREIIHDFSAHVEPGMKVAIVGPTGAGKTTMVNLLMRFYEVNGGSVSIDGVKTSEMRREEIRDIFGMVLQDTWVFEGTLRENLVYNTENVSDEQINEALSACGLSHFVNLLPNGLDSELTEATTISAGQKQLITIARAMIRKAPLLILDEATSNVDTRTEELIQKAMDELTKGRTSFVIAHRLSTIKNADLILVMKDGNIVEQGTHNSLMEENGFYAGLYNSQFAFE